MTEKKKQELTEDEKSELLYKLLFKDKGFETWELEG